MKFHLHSIIVVFIAIEGLYAANSKTVVNEPGESSLNEKSEENNLVFAVATLDINDIKLCSISYESFNEEFHYFSIIKKWQVFQEQEEADSDLVDLVREWWSINSLTLTQFEVESLQRYERDRHEIGSRHYQNAHPPEAPPQDCRF